MKGEYGPLGPIDNILFSSKFMNGPIKLECLSIASLSSLVQCNTSLFGTFVSYEENEGLRIRSHRPYSQHFISFVIYEWAH
jgi:hypothetical protein